MTDDSVDRGAGSIVNDKVIDKVWPGAGLQADSACLAPTVPLPS